MPHVCRSSIYYSIDGGTNWAPQLSSPSKAWVRIVASDDGQVLVASEDEIYGNVWVSIDSGSSWELQEDYIGPQIALNRDGNKLYAVTGEAAADGLIPPIDFVPKYISRQVS